MPAPDTTTDLPVVPPPILDPPPPPANRAERRAVRRRARRRRLRRIAYGLGLLVLCTAAWVVMGHTDSLGEVALAPTTHDGDVPEPELDEPDASGRLDEPGGLITGPHGITRGDHQRVVSNRLVVVGDSVLQAAAPFLPEHLPAWSLVADTRVGRFLPEAIEVLRKRSDQLGEVVVLNLGNNYNGDEVAFAAEVEEAMTVLAEVDHVIWLTVGEYEPEQVEVNTVLRSAAEVHRNLVLLDWNTIWQNSDGWTGYDDLHLTPEGSEVYARFVARGVRKVTRLADVVPAPNPAEPEIVTKGSVPSGSGKGETSRRRNTATTTPRRRVPRATAPPTTEPPASEQPTDPGVVPGNGSGQDPQPPVTEPPAPPPGPEPDAGGGGAGAGAGTGDGTS